MLANESVERGGRDKPSPSDPDAGEFKIVDQVVHGARAHSERLRRFSFTDKKLNPLFFLSAQVFFVRHTRSMHGGCAWRELLSRPSK